jgi:shikimate kinase
MTSPQDNDWIDAPIFLIGFMGAGKTTVGQALAVRMNCDFLDLDREIEAGVGKSISQIFSDEGEAEFRRLEGEAISRCGSLRRVVIALGGGAYLSEENRNALRQIGTTVWLDCPVEVCLQRIAGDRLRPLLKDESEMRMLLEQRRSAYSQADCVVSVGELSPDAVASEIEKLVRTVRGISQRLDSSTGIDRE